MKKIFFLVLTFLLTTELTAACPTAKILPKDNVAYMFFSDGTLWKVTTFVKRWRGPIEWLSGMELYVPENYLCDLGNWCLGEEFDVYPKLGNIRVDESHASNQEELKEYTYLLVNPRTEKILFGLPLNPADFMTELYNQGHSKGYDSGYSEGYSFGYSAGHAAGKLAGSQQN